MIDAQKGAESYETYLSSLNVKIRQKRNGEKGIKLKLWPNAKISL